MLSALEASSWFLPKVCNSWGALEALLERRISSEADLDAWYAEANGVRRAIVANPDLVNAMPHFVWHYLSDADVRFKDARVAIVQDEVMRDIVAALKRGQVPPPA